MGQASFRLVRYKFIAMDERGWTIATPNGCMTLQRRASVDLIYMLMEYFDTDGHSRIPSVIKVDQRFIDGFSHHLVCCGNPLCSRQAQLDSFLHELQSIIGQKIYLLNLAVETPQEYDTLVKLTSMINEGYDLFDAGWLINNKFVEVEPEK